MRCPFLAAALFLFSTSAMAGTTHFVIDTDVHGMDVYIRGNLASATVNGQYFYTYGGTVGNVKGLGPAVTLGGTPYSANGKARFYVIQYPFVTGGWYRHYETKNTGTTVGLESSGTYTVEGTAGSMAPH
jgi:hypothetical protein